MEEVEWDENKNILNQQNHEGISFEEAATVFSDDFALFVPDHEHSFGEQRYTMIGMSSALRVLRVTYIERGRKLRIISARPATKYEEKEYAKQAY